MKPQDILFVLILVALIIFRKPKILVVAGLICLGVSIPLFSLWIFFTAQRLVYYAGAFLLSAVLMYLIKVKK